MSSISLDTLVLAKKYTDKVLSGLGALKGSPCTIKATKENDDGSITVTFAWTGSDGVEETQDVIIPAGPQGERGIQGEKGTDGTNGVSPTVTITEIEDGHTITITDADGTQSFNVLNGADGAGEENVIEEIKVNGVALAPDENKSVNITIPTVDVDKNYVDTELAKKANTSDIPTKVSELQNDSNYQTDTDVTTTLTPYATKTYVGEQISNADHLKREIVTEIPDASTANEHTIYMLKIESATGNDKYREYLLIDGTMQCTGDTSVDLTDYAKTADIDNKLDNKADKTEIPTFTNKTVLDGITSEKVADWDEAVTTKTALEAHTNSIVSSKTGVHGMRYFNDTLQVQNEDNEWVDIETGGSGGGSGIAPNNVSDINLKTGNTKLTISWSDPSDTIIEGQTLSTWKGTKLIQKVGSFPENPKDGTLLLDNQTRDKYKTSGFEITGLTNGETYYFALFPYSDTGATNLNTANRISGTPQPYRTMTAVIDLTNSNPLSAVTYADDAAGMTKGSADWDDFFGHYPCMLNNGVEGVKLNPDNFAKDVDGNNVDITSGSAGDVMIAFPRRGLKISTSGSVVTISMTDDPDAEGFEYNAHTRGSTAKDVFYLGAYKGYESSSKLRSLSGKTITASKTIGAFRTSAQANGSGYEQSGFYQLIFRQAMYVLKYKNLDSQSTIGQGYVKSTHSAAIATGGSEAYGMDSEIIRSSTPSYMTDQEHHVKLFGLEDFWGNIWEWIDGLVTNSTRNILTANSSFNDSGSGYTDNGQGASADIGGYMNKVQGGTKTGFIAKEVSGSASTYYTDYGYLFAGKVAKFGGHWDYGANAGAFQLAVNYASSFSHANIAARLMYL